LRRIRWTQLAICDLTGICDYLESHESPAFAARVAQAVHSAAYSLARFPKKGRPGREPGTRELVIQKHPHVIVYEERGNSVEVLRVVHTSQQWP